MTLTITPTLKGLYLALTLLALCLSACSVRQKQQQNHRQQLAFAKHQAAELRSELKSLRTDKLKLYWEKLDTCGRVTERIQLVRHAQDTTTEQTTLTDTLALSLQSQSQHSQSRALDTQGLSLTPWQWGCLLTALLLLCLLIYLLRHPA